MIEALNRLKANKGATKVEYALLLSLLTFITIPISQLSDSMGSVFATAGCAVDSNCIAGSMSFPGMVYQGGGSESTNPEAVSGGNPPVHVPAKPSPYTNSNNQVEIENLNNNIDLELITLPEQTP